MKVARLGREGSYCWTFGIPQLVVVGGDRRVMIAESGAMGSLFICGGRQLLS